MLLLIFFAHILSATELSYSSILIHFLQTNGYMSPSDKIKLLTQSPSFNSFNRPLAQILTKAQENTQLIVPTDSLDFPNRQTGLNLVEPLCFRDVLDGVNILHVHQAWFRQEYNSAESNVDKYDYRLYWAKKDVNFVLSIAYSNRALNIVIQSLNSKVSKLTEEFNTMFVEVLPYSERTMKVCRDLLPLAPLAPFNLEFATANPAAEPKVHYSLLNQLLRRKLINAQFVTVCKKQYSACYQRFLKYNGENIQKFSIPSCQAPKAIIDNYFLFLHIADCWITGWYLGMRIKRAMPSPSDSALGPGLIESFRMEVNALNELVGRVDSLEREYELGFSCHQMDYLIGCMRFALLHSLLNAQDHGKCVELITDHRILALEVIDSLRRLHTLIQRASDQQLAIVEAGNAYW